MEDALHDALQLCIDLFEGPAQALGVLAHLQAGGGHAAGVGSLCGSVQNAVCQIDLDGLRGAGHVGAFADDGAAVLDQSLSGLLVDLVLGRAGQGDVAGDGPDLAAIGHVGCTLVGLSILLDAAAADFLQILDVSQVDAVGVIDIAVGVGHGDDLAAQLGGLLAGIDGDIAGTGDDHGLAGKAVVAHALQGLGGEVAQAVAGRLSAGQRTTEGQALAGEHAALEAVGQALVLAEQVADLAAADADVTGGAVHELADVAVQLGHEALAEAHDFHVALALGVEVRAALAAAHGQGGQAVLEGLLKAQELQDALVDRGMEAQTALVGADGAVELHTVAAVDLDLAFVIDPGHTEADDTLRLDQTLDQSGLLIFGVLLHDGLDALQHLADSLQKFGLIGIALSQTIVNTLQVFIRQHNRILLFPVYFHRFCQTTCRTLYHYKAFCGDLQEKRSRKSFKKTEEKMNPLHKNIRPLQKRRSNFYFAEDRHLKRMPFAGEKARRKRQRNQRVYFFSSFSQASAAPSRYSPP